MPVFSTTLQSTANPLFLNNISPTQRNHNAPTTTTQATNRQYAIEQTKIQETDRREPTGMTFKSKTSSEPSTRPKTSLRAFKDLGNINQSKPPPNTATYNESSNNEPKENQNVRGNKTRSRQDCRQH